MLVLLILLAITIPIATQAIQVDLPSGVSRQAIERLRNTLSLDADGMVRWNGNRVDEAGLASLLRNTARMPVEPELRSHTA